MTDLNFIIDAMLPGDHLLGMPSGSSIGFDIYLKHNGLTSLSLEFIHMLEKVCEEKLGDSFASLDGIQKMQAINACKLVDVRLFSIMVSHLFKAYYTAPSVLNKIGAGSVPPFPNGNFLEEDDWSILEPVYERGSIFREVP
jgi:hypothetical protein